MEKKEILWRAALFLPMMLLFWGFLSCRTVRMPTKSSNIFDVNRISTVFYTLNSPVIAENTSISIALISDLHSTIYREGQTGLLDLIRRSNPDLILLSGDIFDEKILDEGTDMLLRGIQDTVPIFYAIGNNEYMRPDAENLMADRKSVV